MYSNLSVKNHLSKGRVYSEENSIREPFERDRDRLYHSTAFRKLKDKTQVFMFEKGDFYRNRLTHTLEVSQISRSLARRLNVNEDLSECIALSHDLGHPPFGHLGEEIIRSKLQSNFDHNVQSFRQVTFLEKRYMNFSGLNLSYETLDGIIKHNGTIDLPVIDYDLSESFTFDLKKHISLEAQIASISDDIAYLAHDFDDGLRSNILILDEVLSLESFKEIINLPSNTDNKIIRNELTRQVINFFILDILKQTSENIKKNSIKSFDDLMNFNEFLVMPSGFGKKILQECKIFLFSKLYNSALVNKGKIKAQNIISFIIQFYTDDFKKIPLDWRELESDNYSKQQIIIDYICGMTDRYSVEIYDKHN